MLTTTALPGDGNAMNGDPPRWNTPAGHEGATCPIQPTMWAGAAENKRHRRFLGLAMVFFSLLLAGSALAASRTVMVYGDSLSAAYGISTEAGWVAMMAQRLAARNVAVVNASISGETTRGGLSRIGTDLQRHRPALVVLALGANDGLRGLPVAETRRNLTAILNAIKTSGAGAVLVGIQIPPNYGIDYVREFKSLYPALAKERGIPLVPFLLDGIADDLSQFQADRLHPIAAAQPRILQNVLPVVERALGVPSSRKPLKQ